MSKYSKEFKEEALKLSDEIGVKKAALQLGLQYYTLADWRKARMSENICKTRLCRVNPEFCVNSLLNLQNDV